MERISGTLLIVCGVLALIIDASFCEVGGTACSYPSHTPFPQSGLLTNIDFLIGSDNNDAACVSLSFVHVVDGWLFENQ